MSFHPTRSRRCPTAPHARLLLLLTSLLTACVVDQDNDGWSAADSDRDDTDPGVHPEADELCNGRDDNCDDISDDSGATAWFPELEGDGYGSPAAEMHSFTQPIKYNTNNTNYKNLNTHLNPRTLALLLEPVSVTGGCRSRSPGRWAFPRTGCGPFRRRG